MCSASSGLWETTCCCPPPCLSVCGLDSNPKGSGLKVQSVPGLLPPWLGPTGLTSQNLPQLPASQLQVHPLPLSSMAASLASCPLSIEAHGRESAGIPPWVPAFHSASWTLMWLHQCWGARTTHTEHTFLTNCPAQAQVQAENGRKAIFVCLLSLISSLSSLSKFPLKLWDRNRIIPLCPLWITLLPSHHTLWQA